MPTYEYQCSACGHKFEEFQSITAKPTRKCPKCGKNTVNRLISAGAGIIFKGSGFYETDYRSDAYKTAAKSDAGPSKSDSPKTDSGKSGSGKSEAGSTAAAESKSATENKPAGAPASAKKKDK